MWVTWGDGQATSMIFFSNVVVILKYPQIKFNYINLLRQSNCSDVYLQIGIFFLELGCKIQPQVLPHDKFFCPSVRIFALDMHAANSCFLANCKFHSFSHYLLFQLALWLAHIPWGINKYTVFSRGVPVIYYSDDSLMVTLRTGHKRWLEFSFRYS